MPKKNRPRYGEGRLLISEYLLALQKLRAAARTVVNRWGKRNLSPAVNDLDFASTGMADDLFHGLARLLEQIRDGDIVIAGKIEID